MLDILKRAFAKFSIGSLERDALERVEAALPTLESEVAADLHLSAEETALVMPIANALLNKVALLLGIGSIAVGGDEQEHEVAGGAESAPAGETQ